MVSSNQVFSSLSLYDTSLSFNKYLANYSYGGINTSVYLSVPDNF